MTARRFGLHRDVDETGISGTPTPSKSRPYWSLVAERRGLIVILDP